VVRCLREEGGLRMLVMKGHLSGTTTLIREQTWKLKARQDFTDNYNGCITRVVESLYNIRYSGISGGI
jgi:hypothetical protein